MLKCRDEREREQDRESKREQLLQCGFLFLDRLNKSLFHEIVMFKTSSLA